MRYSKQREIIKSIVLNTKIHPSADWIYQETKKQIPSVSLGTVYRNLKQLVKWGEIIALHTGSVIRYDGNISKHNHLKCVECRELIDVNIQEKDLVKDISKKYNFSVSEIELIAIGKCSKHK